MIFGGKSCTIDVAVVFHGIMSGWKVFKSWLLDIAFVRHRYGKGVFRDRRLSFIFIKV
uniref:AlNc14C195G8547 protein n=1 Tax=Albugo laibachii Nc14 TaxID=890382 RepID=F0WQ66_9STRA|nr:AlNc14C195G8547 [Albugo laibachii Nc14]|eukprot:CCA23472.1 AlNc14C195G8547 [Albugo laibachii Nc14]